MISLIFHPKLTKQLQTLAFFLMKQKKIYHFGAIIIINTVFLIFKNQQILLGIYISVHLKILKKKKYFNMNGDLISTLSIGDIKEFGFY